MVTIKTLLNALTPFRQSGVNFRFTFGCIIACTAPDFVLAGAINWAHQSGQVQTNGSLTVKTLSGGSYSAGSNLSGAVAKANQNSANQSATVLIQATSAGYSEAIPIITSSSSRAVCPTGYSVAWSANSTPSSPFSSMSLPIMNVAGTRFSFGAVRDYNGSSITGWIIDQGSQMMAIGVVGTLTGTPYANSSNPGWMSQSFDASLQGGYANRLAVTTSDQSSSNYYALLCVK